MIVSIHQPAYLPWLGYFEKVAKSDLFVFLDTVQFEKNSFINRNKIKTSQGPIWLTVPVKSKGHLSSSLSELFIDDVLKWKMKHLKSIEANYRKATAFHDKYEKLISVYETPFERLSDLCYAHLFFWCKELGITTKIVRSSSYTFTETNSDLVLEICRHFGADVYISGALGKNYLDENSFHMNGIQVEYQQYIHPEYPQLWGDFIPYMGVVDYWMNSENPFFKI